MPRAAAAKAPIRIALLLLLAVILNGQTRVNVGGPLYVDSNSNTWLADTGCTGTTYSQGAAVSGTIDDTLYQTGRTGNNFSCEFAVSAPAFYYITVRLAEYVPSYTSTNPRIFNVFVNGSNARTINTSVNCASQLSACDFTFGPYAIYETTLTVSFSTVSQPAFVNAIQVTNAGISGDSTVSNLTITKAGADVRQLTMISPTGVATADLLRFLDGNDTSKLMSGVDGYGQFFVKSPTADGNKKKVGMSAYEASPYGLALSSDAFLGRWKSVTDLDTAGSYDSGISRSAAGVVEINTATAGTLGILRTKLPTSCTALPAGMLYNNAGTPAICP